MQVECSIFFFGKNRMLNFYIDYVVYEVFSEVRFGVYNILFELVEMVFVQNVMFFISSRRISQN